MLHIQEKIVAQYGVLRLGGRFDFYGVEKFKAALKNMEKTPLTHLIIDLSQVPFMDSVSLGVLVAAQKRLSKNEITICLIIDPNTATGQVMTHTSLQTMMPTFHTIKEAVSSLTSSGA